MSEASVVDLPAPVAPVTSTRPLFKWQSSFTDSGSPSSSGVGILNGKSLIATAIEPLWWNTFTRKRLFPSNENEKSISPFLLNSSISLGLSWNNGSANSSISFGITFGPSSSISSPSIRSTTGFPAVRWISEAFFSYATFKIFSKTNFSMSISSILQMIRGAFLKLLLFRRARILQHSYGVCACLVRGLVS